MVKLNAREKLIAYSIIGFLALALGYLYLRQTNIKEKIITLENKEYLGTLLNGVLDNHGYQFVSPPIKIGVPKPSISNFERYVGYEIESEKKKIPVLKSYQRVNKVDSLSYRVENESHPEFNARQDTLEMLIDKFHEN